MRGRKRNSSSSDGSGTGSNSSGSSSSSSSSSSSTSDSGSCRRGCIIIVRPYAQYRHVICYSGGSGISHTIIIIWLNT